jgi:hypothetical protein
MGVNQVSLSFYPPLWRPHVTVGRWNAMGQPIVYVAESVPAEGAAGSPVRADELRNWLAARGIRPAAWGGGSVFEQGQVRSIFGVEKAVEFSLAEVAGEVTEVYCRFTLPRPGPPPLETWAEFAVSLCGQFGLRLGAEGAALCRESEFLAAVQSCPNYREFAAGGQQS